MAYSESHVLLRLLGKFGTTAASELEEWGISLRIRMGGEAPFLESDKVALLNAVATPAKTFHQDTTVAAGIYCHLTELTAAYIGADGHYVGGATQDTTHLPIGPWAGSNNSGSSWDVARTYTLRTAAGRGLAHAGRFYYPCVQLVADDGRWTGTQVAGAADAAANFLNAVNTAADTVWDNPLPGGGGSISWGVSVMSQGSTVGAGGPLARKVIRVEIGRVPDTQRRRTKSLVEDYVGKDLAGAAAVRAERNVISAEATD